MSTQTTDLWKRIDAAFWQGTLLNLRSEISSANLYGTEYDTADLIFRAEEGTLDASNPKYASLVAKLGQEGPADYSARASLAFAQTAFFGGQWQLSLDSLHQSVVTALNSEHAKSTELRRIRAEVYFRLADFWTIFRQPGMVLVYLRLAHKVLEEPSARLHSRLRLLFSNESPSPGALMYLLSEGKWGTTYFRLIDRTFLDLPEIILPSLSFPDEILFSEGLKAGFEICISEALNLKNNNRLKWAEHAVYIAELMKVPAWLAVADITVSFLVGKEFNIDLAERHLSRALYLIKKHNLDGLLVYAMMANHPIIEANFGRESAANQAQEAIQQVIKHVKFFRDLVLRRRLVWAFERVFIDAFEYAKKVSNMELAFQSVLKSKGLGWSALRPVVSNKEEILQARKKETGPLLIGEELFEPTSMRNEVFGPHERTLPDIYGEANDMMKISDTIARNECLQHVRENVFGMSNNLPINNKAIQKNVLEMFFIVDNNKIIRIDKWENKLKPVLLEIRYNTLSSNVKRSGLSTTVANRFAPVDYGPIEESVEQLFMGLPDKAKNAKYIKIWPHGILNSIPFTYAVRSLLPQKPLVTVLLAVETSCSAKSNEKVSVVRLAPSYMGNYNLTYAASEVQSVKSGKDIVISNTTISAENIIYYLLTGPSLFHFAGHAVNRNDQSELAGLYASDLRLVSVADILNVGCGPKATVLSACETGPGPLHSADGSYSLPRAFLQVGSEWVLASLWKIGDEETYFFMKSFFKKLQQGFEPEAALPQNRHPFVLYRSGNQYYALEANGIKRHSIGEHRCHILNSE